MSWCLIKASNCAAVFGFVTRVKHSSQEMVSWIVLAIYPPTIASAATSCVGSNVFPLSRCSSRVVVASAGNVSPAFCAAPAGRCRSADDQQLWLSSVITLLLLDVQAMPVFVLFQSRTKLPPRLSGCSSPPIFSTTQRRPLLGQRTSF